MKKITIIGCMLFIGALNLTLCNVDFQEYEFTLNILEKVAYANDSEGSSGGSTYIKCFKGEGSSRKTEFAQAYEAQCTPCGAYAYIVKLDKRDVCLWKYNF